jgi:hypothetical protein
MHLLLLPLHRLNRLLSQRSSHLQSPQSLLSSRMKPRHPHGEVVLPKTTHLEDRRLNLPRLRLR